VEQTASDPKVSAFKFRQCNGPLPVHHFDDVRGAISGGKCACHPGQECPALSVRDDLMVIGFPCQPYSTQRQDQRVKV
jgi:hypothetical protein